MAIIKSDIRLDQYPSITNLIAALHPCILAQPGDMVQINLDLRCEKEFIYAEKLLILACLLADLRSKGIDVLGFVNGNWDGSAAKYASRINFFQHIDLSYTEGFKRHQSQGRFLEITRYTKESIKDIDIHIHSIFAKEKWIHQDVLQLLYYCLYEIMDNVLEHAGRDNGWVCAQFFPQLNEIRIVIADSGKGIHHALLTNPKYIDITEVDSLLLCIQKGVSAGSGRGFGLYATSEFVRHNQGDLLIYSGQHYLHHSDHDTIVELGSPWLGTIVCLKIHTNIPVDYHKIMPPGHALPDNYQEFIDQHIGKENELW